MNAPPTPVGRQGLIMNIAVLSGTLSSAPSSRVLPSGTRLVTLEVSTERDDGSRCSVPVAWFDAPDEPPFVDGDSVVVVGEVRRRFFRVGSSTQSRTEVLARTVVLGGDRRRVRTALRQCAERLGADPGRAVRSRP